jgi:hypothetical protein
MKNFVKVRLKKDWKGYKAGSIIDVLPAKFEELSKLNLVTVISNSSKPTKKN